MREMYETFFSMKHTPFIRSIPTDMLYSDSETDEIQNRLVYASDRQLFATLVGDSGCGKTTALRRLHETLSGKGRLQRKAEGKAAGGEGGRS